ncbi:hypothetical protein V6N13_131742 [Hibiscus sabdariffa]
MTGIQEADHHQSVSLDLLKQKMADFAKERDWDRFHSPRNLLLALGNCRRYSSGKGRSREGWRIGKKRRKFTWAKSLGLSDVLLYLVRLSDICGVDLGKAALRKVELNAIKYPASKQYTTDSDGAVNMSD